MTIISGPSGRGRPGPGLKVDRHANVRLGAPPKPKPPRCHAYGSGYVECSGRAVVEVVQRIKYHDAEEQVNVALCCVQCMHLSGHDDEKSRRRPHGHPGHYRRRRVTWLTTLVNGEVPA